MSDIAIKVENLSKRYRIGEADPYKTLRESVSRAAVAPFKWLRSRNGHATTSAPSTNNYQLATSNSSPATINSSSSNPSSVADQAVNGNIIWALKDVSFEVKQGEVLGIIGRNGAGKSTLLKILSRITEPTTGRAEIYGRVGSLLEVGTGFHPELTGRENIYLNGAILGMSRQEIKRCFDEIVDFSGVERFIDTPVKRYSSGMAVRLAFAVAAHLEPEILIVDEVLAVGDAEFQNKCLGKMDEVARSGRTVLFVSHNMAAVRTLCTQAISLHNGLIHKIGEISHVVADYLGTFNETCHRRDWNSPDDAPGNGRVRLKSISIRSVAECTGRLLPIDRDMVFSVEFWNFRPSELNISLHVMRGGGETAFVSASPCMSVALGSVRFEARIPANLLNDGTHTLKLMIVERARPLFTFVDALSFDTEEPQRNGQWLGRWPGAVRPQLNWQYAMNTPNQ